MAVPAYGNRNRWSVGDGLTLRCKLPGVSWLPVIFLTGAYEFSIGEYVALHCSLDLRACRSFSRYNPDEVDALRGRFLLCRSGNGTLTG